MSKARKIVMLTHDTKIDRRILLEAESLREQNFEVVIIALGDEKNNKNQPGIIRTEEIAQTLSTSRQKDRFYSLYYWLRNRIYGFSTIQKSIHFLAWIVLWLKLCWQKKQLIMRSPPEIFFNHLFLDLAIAEKGDIYVAHDLTMLPTAYHAAQKYHARLVYDSHELYSEQSFIWLEKLMWRRIEKEYIYKANAIITINPSVAEALNKRYPNLNINIIYNAEKLRSTPIVKPKYFHQLYHLKDDIKVILYQGGYFSDRNLLQLILAMQHITNDKLCLVLLGEGQFFGKLDATIKKANLVNKVFLHPAVPQESLLNLTMSADVGVIPYIANCLNNLYCTPNKLFEFIIAELPIIASNLPELREIIETNRIGMVTEMRDIKRIAKALDDFFTDRNFLVSCQEHIKIAKEMINWEVESKKLKLIYCQL